MVKAGIAPINWTNDDVPELGGHIPFEQCVSEMALAGFTGCEVGNKFPKERHALKEALDLRGLTICNQWFSILYTSAPEEVSIKNLREQCDFLKFIGAGVIGASEQGNSIQGNLSVPILGDKPSFSEEEWMGFCLFANKLGKIAFEEYGIKFCYHYHLGTTIQTEKETERFIENTDERYVSLVYDSGHATCAGDDPVAVLKKYISRIKHIHIKSVRSNVLEKMRREEMCFLDGVKEGLFTVPGDGDTDFDPIYKVIRDSDYDGWVVVEAEQDPDKADPLTYAKIARESMRKGLGI